MSIEQRVVVNSSPLITLFKSQLAFLLPQLFTEILVPEAVWEEVVGVDKTDAASSELPTASWVTRIEISEIDSEIAAWGLGAGESEVLSIVLERPNYHALIDDLAARRCARSLEISHLGSCGTIVLAKRRGLITSISSPIERLRDVGLWLSEDLVSRLKQQAGELE